MKDPFGLAPNIVEPTLNQYKPKKTSFRGLYAGLAVFAVVIFAGTSVIFLNQQQISADVVGGNYLAKIDFANFPATTKTGNKVTGTVTVTNQGTQDITKSYLLVQGHGVNLSQTAALSNLMPTQSGYLHALSNTQSQEFTGDSSGGFYWYVGDLGANQSKSQQIIGKVTGDTAKIEGKFYTVSTQTTKCGTLNLKTCVRETGQAQVSYDALEIELEQNAKLSLRAGYNFVTLPYIFSPVSASNFLGSLHDRWAYYFKTSNAEYVNLLTADNSSYLKPGNGFWIYSSNGESVDLPTSKVETNSNDNYSVNLDIGWNNIGNPYTKRIILSGEKILVREFSEDGSANGAVYNLTNAIQNNVLSSPYTLLSKNFTDSNAQQNELSKVLQWKITGFGSTLDPFIGVMIKSDRKVALIFPGKDIIALGDLLSSAEKTRIDSWVAQNGLNEFGDPAGAAYSGGVPLDANSSPINRYDYILRQHTDSPWNKNSQ